MIYVDQWAAKSAPEVTMPVLSDTVRSGFAIKCDLARLAVTFGIKMLIFFWNSKLAHGILRFMNLNEPHGEHKLSMWG